MKKLILSAVIGIVLCAAALSLNSCSKDDKENIIPGDRDPELELRHVFLHIENGSSYRDDQVNIHFNFNKSQSDQYEYCTGESWRDLSLDEFWPLSKTTMGYVEGPGRTNFTFCGRVHYDWYQRVTVSIDHDNQQDLQINGKGHLNDLSDISISMPWTRGGERRIEFEVIDTYLFRNDWQGNKRLGVCIWLKIRDVK